MVLICEICGARSEIKRDFSLNTPTFKFQYHFSNVPPSYSASNLFLAEQQMGEPGDLPAKEFSQSLITNKYTYYTNIYFTLSGCYMFRLVAILMELKTKYLKSQNNKLVPTMLRMGKYRLCFKFKCKVNIICS